MLDVMLSVVDPGAGRGFSVASVLLIVAGIRCVDRLQEHSGSYVGSQSR